MKARITRLRKDIELPEYKSKGAVAFDITICENATIAPGKAAFLPTGLIIQVPEGQVLVLAPRSSTFKKKGLRLGNTLGIIDQDFCGPEDELLIHLWNPGTEPVSVAAGERIVQGLFLPFTHIEWDEGEPLGKTRGGWGSTGG